MAKLSQTYPFRSPLRTDKSLSLSCNKTTKLHGNNKKDSFFNYFEIKFFDIPMPSTIAQIHIHLRIEHLIASKSPNEIKTITNHHNGPNLKEQQNLFWFLSGSSAIALELLSLHSISFNPSYQLMLMFNHSAIVKI